MSPEQAEGKQVDARSDIFGFGAVLYEMVTGHRAFSGDTNLSILTAILHEEPRPSDFVPGLPAGLDRLIAWCLRKDLQRRIQHIDDVKLALEDLKTEWETVIQASPLPASRRRPWRLAMSFALVAIFVSLALAAWFYWVTRTRNDEPVFSVVPLTTYPGREVNASF